jgi:hypothetical protein
VSNHGGVETGSARGTVISDLNKAVATDKIVVAKDVAIGFAARANDGI